MCSSYMFIVPFLPVRTADTSHMAGWCNERRASSRTDGRSVTTSTFNQNLRWEHDTQLTVILLQTGVDVERVSKNPPAILSNLVLIEIQSLQIGVGLERLSKKPRVILPDLVPTEIQLLQTLADLERVSKDFCAIVFSDLAMTEIRLGLYYYYDERELK